MEAANLIEGERVQIVNINNGERLETYVIKGKRNSGTICLNGPAARRAAVNDIIIIIGYGLDIPNDLQDLITVIQFSLPTETEIIHELTRLLNSLKITIDSTLIENLTRACQGLSLERIRRVLAKIIATYKTLDHNSVSLLLEEKKQIIRQTEILEYWSTNDDIQNIGGVENVTAWLTKRKIAFSI